MKAIPGRIYAQVLSGRVHWIFTADQLPEWNNDMAPAIDITALDPLPVVGDVYVDGRFFADPGPAPDEYHVLDEATYTWQPLDPATIDTMKADRAQGDFEAMKLFRAKAISDLAWRLGKAPGQLTAEEIRAERDRLVAIYKAL